MKFLNRYKDLSRLNFVHQINKMYPRIKADKVNGINLFKEYMKIKNGESDLSRAHREEVISKYEYLRPFPINRHNGLYPSAGNYGQ